MAQTRNGAAGIDLASGNDIGTSSFGLNRGLIWWCEDEARNPVLLCKRAALAEGFKNVSARVNMLCGSAKLVRVKSSRHQAAPNALPFHFLTLDNHTMEKKTCQRKVKEDNFYTDLHNARGVSPFSTALDTLAIAKTEGVPPSPKAL
ncbi:hypothetical protein F2P81_002284 [Scophthalmus maximus]|uniref:Uncharacterized protein n=1 Tax=Scophthalmus maximus TaxID=52904 RepID=A0A6A4TKK7_SCOMX|nr:hypothetical protein F2P81_002284 [Scophthalmus maximus]